MMYLKLNGEDMPAKFNEQTLGLFKLWYNQIIDNDILGIEFDNQVGPMSIALVTLLLRAGYKEQGREIDFHHGDVYHWIDAAYEGGTWNENLKVMIKNFAYSQNEN